MTKPVPRVTPDSQPFWDACKRHEWMLPFCVDCGRAHLPPGPVCPHCFGAGLQWRHATGRGKISSWVTVHKAWLSGFARDIPYNVVQVELDEGPRLTTSLHTQTPVCLSVGLPVVVDYEDVNPDLTLPRFRPSSEA
jgi:uncharacterized protein